MYGGDFHGIALYKNRHYRSVRVLFTILIAIEVLLMQAATVSPEYVKFALKGAISKGYNAENIIQNQGLPVQVLTNPRLRISTLAFAELSRALTELLQDESVGLLAKPTPIGSLKLMAKACLSSTTIWESFNTWRDCLNLMDSSVSADTFSDKRGNLIAFSCQKAPGLEGNYAIESQLTGCHRFHCWLANDFVPIESVDLAYPEPAISAEHRFLFYGASVNYGQRRNALHFSSDAVGLKNMRSKGDLQALLSQPLAYIMRQPRQSNSTSLKVRHWMEQLFRGGEGYPQMSEACTYLGFTQPTLRRRLSTEGYSFKQLKEDTRRDMAIFYIKQSELSIEKIGFKLGFSEASTFIRSFKKWTGVTPLAYRKM